MSLPRYFFFRRVLPAGLFLFISPMLHAGYEDIVSAFELINSSTSFPVEGKTFDDIEETFGPRAQPSQAGSYDWHRGIDIDGTTGENILNVYDGVFEKIAYTASAGNYVVIKHTLPNSVTFGTNPNKQSWTTFYTYYLHLTDETVDYVNNTKAWTKGDAISVGTILGYLGSTGSSGGTPYAPHLHFELRFGSSNPLENQIAGDGLTVTDAWFDPHMHPLLLYNPDNNILRGDSAGSAYTQTLIRQSAGTTEGGQTFLYGSSLDELPALNRFVVEVLEAGTENVVLSHVLDYNQRIGFDASTNELLDEQDTSQPYVYPLAFTDEQTDYESAVVVPDSWLGSYLSESYEVRVTASDIWLNSTALTVSAVPEPAHFALLGGLMGFGLIWIRGRVRISGPSIGS